MGTRHQEAQVLRTWYNQRSQTRVCTRRSLWAHGRGTASIPLSQREAHAGWWHLSYPSKERVGTAETKERPVYPGSSGGRAQSEASRGRGGPTLTTALYLGSPHKGTRLKTLR